MDIEWAIYYEKKRKTKWKQKQKQKATGQRKWRRRKKKKKKKRKRNLNIVEHSIWRKERKKERTDIFSKIDSTSVHRLKKRRKENWTFLNCDCNIVLTCCKVKLFEFVWV